MEIGDTLNVSRPYWGWGDPQERGNIYLTVTGIVTVEYSGSRWRDPIPRSYEDVRDFIPDFWGEETLLLVNTTYYNSYSTTLGGSDEGLNIILRVWIDESAIFGSDPTTLTQKMSAFAVHLSAVIQEATGSPYMVYIGSPLLQKLQGFGGMLLGVFLIFSLFSVPSIVIALFLTAFSLGLVRKFRRRQIGIMRTRGASSRQILLTLISESFIHFILTSFLGLTLSLPLASLILRSNDFLSFNGIPIGVIPSINFILAGITFSFVFVVLSNFNGWRELLRMEPTEGEEPIEKRDPAWKRLYIDIFLLVPGLLILTIFYIVNLWIFPFLISSMTGGGGGIGPGAMLVGLLVGFMAIISFLLAFPAILLLVTGGSMFISRIFPFILGFTGDIAWKLPYLGGGIGALALRNAFRRRQAAVRGVLLLTLCMLFSAVALSVPFTIRTHQENLIAFGTGADAHFKEQGGTINETRLQIINNVSSVISATEYRQISLSIAGTGLWQEYQILGVNTTTFANTAFFLPWFASESVHSMIEHLQKNDSALIHSENSVALSKGVGDTLVFSQSEPLTIEGIFQFWPNYVSTPIYLPANQIFIVVSLDTLDRILDSEGIQDSSTTTGYYVDLLQGLSHELVVEEIENATGLVDGLSIEGQIIDRRNAPDTIVLMSVLNFTIFLSVLTAVIGINLFGISQLIERNKEIGVERALGMKLYQTSILFLMEVASILVFGIIIGLLSGMWLAQVFIMVLVGMHFVSYMSHNLPVFMLYPIDLIMIVCFLIVIFGIVGALFPSIFASRRNISNVLKVE